MDFRKILQDRIKEKKISVAKLARLANLHQDTVYKYLKNKSAISADHLEKLFKILDEQ